MVGLVFYFHLFSYNVVRLLKIKTKIFGPTGLSRVRMRSSGQECGALTAVLVVRVRKELKTKST